MVPMKTLPLILLLAGWTPQDEGPKQIEWAPDLQAAMKQSAETGRPVITYWTFET